MKSYLQLLPLMMCFALLSCGVDDGVTRASYDEDLAGAEATLRNPDGEVVGTVLMREVGAAVHLEAEITNLPPGEHGFHVHETGACEPPDFSSAGGHFNPTDEEHGFESPEGSHVGDMANLIVSDEGMASTFRLIDDAHLGEGPRSMLRAGGTSIVVHARPDDYETDPSGASGPRIACGVVQPAADLSLK